MARRLTYDDFIFYFVRGAFVVGAVLMALFALAAAADIVFRFGWGFTWPAVLGAFATAIIGAAANIALKYLHRLYRRIGEGGGRSPIISSGEDRSARSRRRIRAGFAMVAIRALIVFAFPTIGLWLLNPAAGFAWQMIAVGLVLALGLETILFFLRRSGVFGRTKPERS
jgi:hypothetical protein